MEVKDKQDMSSKEKGEKKRDKEEGRSKRNVLR
jgi:hypothetical protein